MSDDWKCLNCTCTFEGGCEYERSVSTAAANRQRYIPPRRLPLPDIARKHAQGSREEINRKARDNRRKRLEALGFTVTERKRA